MFQSLSVDGPGGPQSKQLLNFFLMSNQLRRGRNMILLQYRSDIISKIVSVLCACRNNLAINLPQHFAGNEVIGNAGKIDFLPLERGASHA